LGETLGLIRGDGDRSILPVTAEDEAQVAGYELLINYVKTLQDIWQRYAATTESETKITGRYSERLSRVNVMLPVIADSNASLCLRWILLALPEANGDRMRRCLQR
jgi:hypothetical protein